MKKKFNNPTIRVIVSIVLGIILGFVVSFIAIFSGYTYIESSSLTEYSVNIFGFTIFDIQKVGEIVEKAKSNAKSFTYGEETKFVVIAETPVDVQTVITVVSKK